MKAESRKVKMSGTKEMKRLEERKWEKEMKMRLNEKQNGKESKGKEKKGNVLEERKKERK